MTRRWIGAKTSASGKSTVWHPLCSWHPKDTSHQIICAPGPAEPAGLWSETSLLSLKLPWKLKGVTKHLPHLWACWGQLGNFDSTKPVPCNAVSCLLGREQKAIWGLQQYGNICSCTTRIPVFQSLTGSCRPSIISFKRVADSWLIWMAYSRESCFMTVRSGKPRKYWLKLQGEISDVEHNPVYPKDL